MDWPRLLTGIALTLGIPFIFLVLPILLGMAVGRFIAHGSGNR